LRAVGARHRHGFIEDCDAQRLDVVATKHRLSLQGKSRNRIGNGIYQQLPPRQRREVAAQENAQRRAVEQLRKCATIRVISYGEIMVGNVAQTDTVGGQPLTIIINNGRDNARISNERRDAGDMADSILQNRDPRRRIAKSRQPRRGEWRLLGFGAQKNPIDARSIRRLCKGAQGKLSARIRLLKHKTLDGAPGAGDDVVSIGRAKAPGHDTPNASKTNDGDSRALHPG